MTACDLAGLFVGSALTSAFALFVHWRRYLTGALLIAASLNLACVLHPDALVLAGLRFGAGLASGAGYAASLTLLSRQHGAPVAGAQGECRARGRSSPQRGGAGCDVFGRHELETALRAQVPAGRISVNGSAKDPALISAAVAAGAALTLDSERELDLAIKAAEHLGKRAREVQAASRSRTVATALGFLPGAGDP